MGQVYDMVLKFKNKYKGLTWRVQKHSSVVEEFINPGEELIYAFCAQKNEKMTEIFNTFVIALTNKRIILGHKRLLWGSFLYSITPDLYNDMEVYKGLLWGKVVIDTVKETVILTNIPNKALDEIETIITDFMMEHKKKYLKNEKED